MVNFVRSRNFIEAVFAAEMKLGLRQPGDYSGMAINKKENGEIRNYNYITSPLIRSVAGKHGGTWVHPYIAIDTATHLDKQLAMDLYEILITSQLFHFREESGDLYKEAYDSVLRLVGPAGRAPAKAQLLARVVAARCGVTIRPDNTTWNYANTEQLSKRATILGGVVYAVDNNLIRDFQVLLETVANGLFREYPDLPLINLAELVKESVATINILEQQLAA
jgi:hypothetical protein